MAHLGHWEHDFRSGRTFWSQDVYDMFGLPPGSVPLGFEEFLDFVHPEDRPLLSHAIKAALASGHALDAEFRIHRTEGELRYIHTRGMPVRDESGEFNVLSGILQDITERKRTEERLRRLARQLLVGRERERQQVSFALHHDAGSLAVGISAHLDAVEEDIRSGKPGEALKWVKRTRELFDESLGRLKRLATQLRPPELDVLGLPAALRQYFSQATECGDTRIHFRETLGRRRVDKDTATVLFRIAQEALTNAISHGRATGVAVGLGASKKEVRLTVRDNGKGFDPSKHGAPETSQIGLHAMKEMAAHAGGIIEVDSTPGKGTTVRVRLPLKAEALGPGDVAVRRKTAGRGKKFRSVGRGPRPRSGSHA